MTTDTILGISGLVIGLIGLITGYIFFRKSVKQKQPYYLIKSNNLFQNNLAQLSGLDILFKDHRVENLTICHIAFWNKGKEVIEKDDIVKSEPLRIECNEDTQILDSSIIKANNNTCEISLNPINLQRVEVSFDYLENNNGAIIQVIHTGKNSQNISFKGKIKGTEIQTISERKNKIIAIFSLILIFLLILSELLPIKEIFGINKGFIINPSLGLLGIIALYINFDYYFGKRKGVPKSLFGSFSLDK